MRQGPLSKLTGRHGPFLNSTGRHYQFLKLPCNMSILRNSPVVSKLGALDGVPKFGTATWPSLKFDMWHGDLVTWEGEGIIF